MKKNDWLIILTYIAMQFSYVIGIPVMKVLLGLTTIPEEKIPLLASIYWLVASFVIGLIIILALLRKDRDHRGSLEQANPMTSIGWAIGGVFLAFLAQTVASNIEKLIGVPAGSENTQRLIEIIDSFPIVIFVSSVIGPILEEIVFRKILFGTLYKRMNFFLAALISSLIFSLAHNELEHVLLYASMGFTFAFLYVKTKRIIVPIFAHIAMNSIVVIIQSIFREYIEELEKLQGFIGGLL